MNVKIINKCGIVHIVDMETADMLLRKKDINEFFYLTQAETEAYNLKDKQKNKVIEKPTETENTEEINLNDQNEQENNEDGNILSNESESSIDVNITGKQQDDTNKVESKNEEIEKKRPSNGKAKKTGPKK